MMLATLVLTSCLCSDETLAERTSPDGRHVAVILSRDCGATTAVAVHIIIRRRWFGSDTAVVLNDPAHVEVEWRSSNELLIRHSPASVFGEESEVDGVRIVRVGTSNDRR